LEEKIMKTILILLVLGNFFLTTGARASSHEDCVPVNAGALTTFEDGGQLILSDGFSRLLAFDTSAQGQAEAATSQSIIEFYGFTQQCFVGRADASLMYWLVGDRIPQGPFAGEDCIPMRNLEVQQIDGRWKIVQVTDDGTIFFNDFGSSEDEARLALQIMTERGFEYQCFVGRPDPSMEYYRTDADSDGDGLLDTWETAGFDADGDGNIDIDLPGMGADPNHKDLFLEFDWMTGQAPTQADILAMKQAFAAAPVDAGGVSNPDGQPGINLWVDTGSLTDANGVEDGGAAGSCGDGADNGGDGVTDANDPDCLVGDNLGGGNSFAASDISNLNSDFYTAKAANFNANRAMIFRYGISARPKAGFGGGWGEIGGNDFIEYNHDGGTIMHELGHTLNLRHGGDVNDNCKPNYVSVMNYDNQFGINQAGGGTIVDYSPPRFAAGRGQAPLGTLTENNLNEATLLDNTDATNQFVFVDSNGAKVRNQLNQAVNYNADADTTDAGLTVNIDTSSTATGRPSACTNASTTDVLTGYDDWTNIVLNFRPFGDSANGAINPVTEPEPDIEDLQIMREELNTTDVQIVKTDSPDPVEVGSKLIYTLTVTNNGPNPADDVQVTDVLPADVTMFSAAGCSEAPAGTLNCDLGSIAARQSQEVDIVTYVNSIHINPANGPTILVNTAEVDNLAGPDPDLGNNSVAEQTTVVDTTPPDLTVPANVTFEADAQCLATGEIGTATATDIGDPNPDISSNSTGTYQLGDNVVIWTAIDDSGNSTSANQVVTVIDVTPPTIVATMDPGRLWPPNHKMVMTTPTLAVADNCSVAGTSLERITMNEGDETDTFEPLDDTTQGDGNTTNDIEVTADGLISLRAERSGKGHGRIYTLIFSVTDGSGNRAEDDTQVVVPHSK
jgi:uncharacterized repeat protein (TIGR01451 family)